MRVLSGSAPESVVAVGLMAVAGSRPAENLGHLDAHAGVCSGRSAM